MTKSSIPRNRLASETSPYLLQHAANPVDWHPWGDEALALAKALDKPILLSVGYSACHWCHVMAHESFEDPATADVMNDLFINIKVDREERPDIDKIYQLTHQLLTRRGGGWPLTVFLDPHQHLPIFAGTYFPRQPRFNLPGFVQLLRKVAAYYRDRPPDLAHNQSALREILDDLSNGHGQADVMDETLLTRAEQTLAAGFDPINGGFGHAPKFPHTSDLQFLHQRSEPCRAAADRKRQMIVTTLTEMASGGIYDQLGGGFFRYSVDDRWDIPHFEKMLYDNGPLLALYAELWRATGDPLFKRVVKETGDWTMGTMQSAEGGYFASLDADSEGGEGRHYTWDPEEIRSVLKPGDAAILESRFGLDRPPNFEGRWHLRVVRSPADICAHLNVVPQAVVEALARARRLMVQRRAQRIWPGRDEKILVAWNGLMIKGMAVAGRLLGRTDFIASAFRAFDFIRADCWKDGRLRAVWKDGRAPLNAYLDDYVMLIDAALELLQAQWRPEVLDWAITLAECTLRHFEDGERGGFYFTADDHEQLIHRPKPLMDESMPSGNAVAVAALARLGHLLGESRYIDASERALRSALPSVARYPDGHGALLCALNEWFHVPRIIILRGDPAAMSAWTSGLAAHPNCLSFAIPTGIVDLPGDLADRKPLGDVVAYVCSGRGCLPPIRTFDDLGSALLDRG